VCAGFIRALIREIRGCFVFCGFINATEFLMSMNDADVARALWFVFRDSAAAAGMAPFAGIMLDAEK
jgi:hypothetical protein